MSENRPEHGDDALIFRLRVIEDQPLERRAEAFAQIHEELRSALEGGDSSTGPTGG
ncbi:hypothetical protein BH09ACT3_BH09ACT3_15380 [soil metagenome]